VVITPIADAVQQENQMLKQQVSMLQREIKAALTPVQTLPFIEHEALNIDNSTKLDVYSGKSTAADEKLSKRCISSPNLVGHRNKLLPLKGKMSEKFLTQQLPLINRSPIPSTMTSSAVSSFSQASSGFRRTSLPQLIPTSEPTADQPGNWKLSSPPGQCSPLDHMTRQSFSSPAVLRRHRTRHGQSMGTLPHTQMLPKRISSSQLQSMIQSRISQVQQSNQSLGIDKASKMPTAALPSLSHNDCLQHGITSNIPVTTDSKKLHVQWRQEEHPRITLQNNVLQQPEIADMDNVCDERREKPRPNGSETEGLSSSPLLALGANVELASGPDVSIAGCTASPSPIQEGCHVLSLTKSPSKHDPDQDATITATVVETTPMQSPLVAPAVWPPLQPPSPAGDVIAERQQLVRHYGADSDAQHLLASHEGIDS